MAFLNFRNFIRQGKHARAGAADGKHDAANSKSPTPIPPTAISVASPPTDANPEYTANKVAIPNLLNDSLASVRDTSADSEQFGSGIERTEVNTNNMKADYNAAALQIVQEEIREKQEESQTARDPVASRFEIEKKMGEGAFSVVYKARDKRSNQNVAIKLVKKTQLDKKQRTAIMKEVAIMRQLDHPHIVSYINFLETPSHYYLILELVPGGELFQKIVQLTYFSEDLARFVIVQLCDAIRYLHDEVGVVHRDIKPENLLYYPGPYVPSKVRKIRKGDELENKVDEGEFVPGLGSGGVGIVKLADFGLSKQVWEANTKTPCGTVGYTAPEVVRDERYSKSVDLWAIGCVLYTILCGFPPFFDESIEALTEKVARGKFTFLSPWWDDISSPAKDLVSKLLTVNPHRRYTIEDVFRHPWIRAGGYILVKGRVRIVKPEVMQLYEAREAIAQQSLRLSGTKFGQPVREKDAGRKFDTSAVMPSPDVLQTPAAVQMKEIFDLGNAVQRKREAEVVKNNGAPGMNLNMLDEEDDESDTLRHNHGNQNVAQEAARVEKKQFELNIKESSILERRKKKNMPLPKLSLQGVSM